MPFSGFPWKAKEDAVMRYFSKRSGEVESVSMINWSRDALPSGRSIVTFEDEASMQKRRTNMQKRRTDIGGAKETYYYAKETYYYAKEAC